MAIENTTFSAPIIVAGMNNTNRDLNTSFNTASTGLRPAMKTKVELPSPPTITRDTLAKRNVVESLSPALRYPINAPKTTSIM